jgi:hypothetical protein
MVGNVIDLKKKSGIVLEKKGLAGITANIVFAEDVSGSIAEELNDGVVQETLDRLLGIGMNMDPDKSIDVYTFNTGAKHIGTANEANYKTFVKDAGIRAGGGTNYAPVMHEIINKYGTPIKGTPTTTTTTAEVEAKGFLGKLFGKKETIVKTETIDAGAPAVQPVKTPTLVFFITDGDNWDKDETRRVITEAAKQGIFWQFVGIGGRERFKFLEELDDLAGRFLDNADFFDAKDIMSWTDEDLYDRILNEFPGWLRQAKSKGLVL